MNLVYTRTGNYVICKIMNICGFSFTFAAAGAKYALLRVVLIKDNFIGRLLRKIIHLPPETPRLYMLTCANLCE